MTQSAAHMKTVGLINLTLSFTFSITASPIEELNLRSCAKPVFAVYTFVYFTVFFIFDDPFDHNYIPPLEYNIIGCCFSQQPTIQHLRFRSSSLDTALFIRYYSCFTLWILADITCVRTFSFHRTAERTLNRIHCHYYSPTFF